MASINFLLQSTKNPAVIYIRLRDGRTLDIKAKTNYHIAPINWDIKEQRPTKKALKDIDIANSVKIFFPAQKTTGTHMNISGAGVTSYAKNKENAVKLIEFLSSSEAQSIFAEGNHEYPVNPKVKASGTVASWGTFKEDNIALNEIGKNTKKAVEIATEGNWK